MPFTELISASAMRDVAQACRLVNVNSTNSIFRRKDMMDIMFSGGLGRCYLSRLVYLS